MRESLYARLAAATGLVFVASIATVAIIGQAKDLKLAGDLALRGGNEVFGWTTLLTGVGAIALFWFASTFAARIRRLEGGSGRLATTVAVSGAFIAGTLALGISVAYAARSANSVGLGALTTAIYAGPGLFFPAAVFVGAGSIVGLRHREELPIYGRVLAMLSAPLALAYIGGAGLMLFKNYAWINDTGYITFLAFTLALSVIGIVRWGEMDMRPAEPEVEEPPAEVVPHPRARRPVPAATTRTASARRRAV